MTLTLEAEVPAVLEPLNLLISDLPRRPGLGFIAQALQPGDLEPARHLRTVFRDIWRSSALRTSGSNFGLGMPDSPPADEESTTRDTSARKATGMTAGECTFAIAVA